MTEAVENFNIEEVQKGAGDPNRLSGAYRMTV